MATYKQLVDEASKKCELVNISGQTALLYLLELCEKQQYDYYMNQNEEISSEMQKSYEQGISRILNHEPMNYVLGFSWFYGYKFIVDDNVLIPRPETEELVANVLAEIDEYFKDYSTINCVDIGTGSGAIAIALAKEETKIKMLATDISESAIEVAKENAKNNDVNIDFLCGSMADPLVENNVKVDFLISNPPYIKQDEKLDESVDNFEPHLALFGGDDGLYFYRLIFEKAKLVLNERAIMAFEMGYDQKETILAEVKKYFGDVKAEVIKDINGKDRMLFVYFI